MSLLWLTEMEPASRNFILISGLILFGLLTMVEIQYRKEQKQKAAKADPHRIEQEQKSKSG